MRTRGYFLTPELQLMSVATSHIAAVMDAPQRFGVTAAHVAETYRSYGEAPPVEGRARAVLLVGILGSAPWIRIREQHGGGWHLQLAPEHDPSCARLRTFARLAQDRGPQSPGIAAFPTDRVTVLDLEGRVRWTGQMAGLSALVSLDAPHAPA